MQWLWWLWWLWWSVVASVVVAVVAVVAVQWPWWQGVRPWWWVHWLCEGKEGNGAPFTLASPIPGCGVGKKTHCFLKHPFFLVRGL